MSGSKGLNLKAPFHGGFETWPPDLHKGPARGGKPGRLKNPKERKETTMPEKVVNLLNAIEAVKGKAYTEGLVDMANILAPSKAEEPKEEKEEKDDGK